MRAATDLLVEGGAPALTIDAIVVRSGVAKSTIYRHWDSRDEILVDAVDALAPHATVPDPALGFRDALADVVGQSLAMLRDPEWARVMPTLMSLKAHAHEIALLEERLEQRQSDAVADVVRRGQAEGVLEQGIDPAEASAVLLGPLLFASLTGAITLDERLAERCIRGFLAAFAA